ncbi:sugar transferase [Blastococcus montanus]|uniref:sugar transferase n=1 Tax=Blastococcus montanus TaxID=3144973 RepID=UPI00320B0A1E
MINVDGGGQPQAEDVRTSGRREGNATRSSESSGAAPRPVRVDATGNGTVARQAWRGAYVRRLAITDAMAAAVAALVGFSVRFGPMEEGAAAPASIWAAVLMPVIWVAVMHGGRTYEQRYLWVGAEEFRRVFIAATMLLAALGSVAWALDLKIARGFIVIALPLATVLTLLSRYAQRRLLHRRRQAGQNLQTTLIVGHRNAVAFLRKELAREAYHGYDAIGCCLPDGDQGNPADFDGLTVLGGFSDIADVVRAHRIDTVAVMPSPELDGAALRRLGWDLEKTHAELLLAPAITEIAGPRVHIRPVCGLPLLHVERPELRGVRRLTKETFDRTAAVLGILALLPVFVAITLAILLTSRGPVLFRQVRIGRDGQEFSMLKFRSMVPGAEKMQQVLAADSDGNGVLFKMRHDPRVTPVGRVLRRYSLDELPQLFNVLRGEMSLVGPRPPLSSEVERYGYDMRRRFLVKPGLTGLWQVSGRSNLSWDDSVRADVRYVENWSLTFDFMILWKTVGAVLRGSGAC